VHRTVNAHPLSGRTADRISSPAEIREGPEAGRGGVWEASDDALLAGYATGDRDAATLFIRRFESKVFGLALAITRAPVDAEEVAQDAFVRAWRYAASYDARRGSVASWLLGIVRNVAIDRVRVSTRHREVVLGELPTEIDHDLDSADIVIDRDAVLRIGASLQSLPPEQREAVVAVMVYGLSAREVSDASDVPLGTVKTRIRLGLRKLRDQLGAQVL
jgi:RNA polymerase sigma factor (sigma-70 family)